MSPVTIFHNPACSNSRGALALIRERGIEPEVIDYLSAPPSAPRLRELIAAMGITPRALLREKEAIHAELNLADPAWSDDELIGFIVQHPILMNRPIVETPLGTRLCRPPETVREILPPAVAAR